MQSTQAFQGVQPFTSPMGSAYPSAPAAAPGGQYEFGDAENRIIGACGTRATVWGAICGVTAGLYGLGAALAVVAFALQAKPQMLLNAAIYGGLFVFNLVLAVTFVGSGRSFASVVKTQGNDVALMMNALQSLSRAFLVQIVVFAIGLLLGIGLLVLAVIAVAMHQG